MANAAFSDDGNLKGFKETKDDFSHVNAIDLARNPGTALFRFWVLRLLLAMLRELDSISYNFRQRRQVGP